MRARIRCLRNFYSKLRGKALRPKTIVRYSREAFLYEPGNVRITLDRNLANGLGSVVFLQPDTFYMRASEPLTILEIKYDAFLRKSCAWPCRFRTGRRRPAQST